MSVNTENTADITADITLNVTDLIFNVAQAAEYLHVARSTFYRLRTTDKTFPKVMYLSDTMPRYRKSELDAWLNSRKQ